MANNSNDGISAMRPRVFVGSSREGKAAAAQLREYLVGVDIDAQLWSDPGIFGLSKTTIESLESALEKFEFAVMVVTPDDVVTSRGKRRKGPRDNIVFELGLFIGAIGRGRAFILAPRGTDLKLPSDLHAVVVAEYDLSGCDGGELRMGDACSKIFRAIRQAPRIPRLAIVECFAFPPLVLHYCLWMFTEFLKKPEDSVPVLRCDAQITVAALNGAIVHHMHPSAIGYDVGMMNGSVVAADFSFEYPDHPFRSILKTPRKVGALAWCDSGVSLLYPPLSRRDNQRMCLGFFLKKDFIYILECHQELSGSPSENTLAAIRGILPQRLEQIAKEMFWPPNLAE